MAEKKKQERVAGYKRPKQKFKSLLVARLLMSQADADNGVNMEDITDHLALYGIEAERRSIYRDIREFQELLELEDSIDCVERDKLNYRFEYSREHDGYIATQRPADFDELKLLAACVHSTKFITKTQAKHLLDTIQDIASANQADELKAGEFITERVKTPNTQMMRSITTINEAIRKKKQIKFQYLQYTLEDKENPKPRRKGDMYQLSPHAMLINDGNYYLLAYVEKNKKIRHYRVDRMKNVDICQEPRLGDDVFSKADFQNYTQRVFSMYSGRLETVRIRCINPLLDTMIERFGKGIQVGYAPHDERHFVVSAPVEVSPPFFGWLCGFGNRVKILSPANVVEEYHDFLVNISQMYEK